MSILDRINDSLSGRAVLYTVGNLALNFLSVIAGPIFVRLMTTSEYGMASVYFTWATMLSNIVSLRVDGTMLNAKSEFGESKLLGYISANLFLCIGSLAVCLGLSLLSPGTFEAISGLEPHLWLLAIITAFFLACSNVRTGYLTAERNALGNICVSFLLALAQVVCSVLFLVLFAGDRLLERVLGYSAPTFLIGLVILIAFFVKGRRFVAPRYWRFCISLSVPLVFNGIAYLLINQCGRLVVNDVLGSSVAGIYSFAYTSAMLSSVVASAFGSAWTTEYYDYLDKGEMGRMRAHANTYLRNMTLIYCVLMLVGPEVLKVLGTEEYYEGIPMLPLIVLAYYFQYLYTWPVNCKFYNKRTKSIAISTFVAAVINVVCCYVGVRQFGMIGAAGAALVAFIALFLIHHITSRGFSNYGFKMRWYGVGILAVVVAAGLTYLFIDVVAVRWLIALPVGLYLLVRIIKTKSLL